MAKRPIFFPNISGKQFVRSLPVEFKWHPGLSKTQKQKSIRSLHEAALKSRGLKRILEISSKSETDIGIKLSAFNLPLKTSSGGKASVEVLFQGSKVFSMGGPFTDLYQKSSREAKKDRRLTESGHLVAFRYDGLDWPLNPQTVFYDWLYLAALNQNKDLAQKLLEYDAFSDIEFNPDRSINCQAASAALYKSLTERKLLGQALSSPSEFLRIHAGQEKTGVPVQDNLF